MKNKYYHFKTDIMDEIFIYKSQKGVHIWGELVFSNNSEGNELNKLNTLHNWNKNYCRKLKKHEIIKYKLLGMK